jgi:hypothetical protein
MLGSGDVWPRGTERIPRMWPEDGAYDGEARRKHARAEENREKSEHES